MIELANDGMQCGDIEEQRTETLLKQSHNKLLILDAVAQSSPLAYLAIDNRDDRILYFNNQFCRMWGIEELSDKMKKGEMKNNDIISFCLELVVDQHSFIEICKSLQDENNRTIVEDEILFIDSRVIRRFSEQVRDEFDNYIGRLYIFEDITERKRNEIVEESVTKRNKELSVTNDKSVKILSAWNKLEKYRLLSEKAKDIILFVRVDGRILEANKAAAKSYGYTYDELCNMTIQDLRGQGRAVITNQQIELADEYGYIIEAIHKRKDGSIFPVEISSQGTTINGQKVLLSIIRDISERKHMQDQLKHMEKYDYLTNIPNRFYLEEFVNNIYTSMQKIEGALLIIDLDNFRVINDSYGHFIGDKVLIGVADCISKKLRKRDFIARLWGDEFAIFLSNTTINEAQIVANKILRALKNEPYYVTETSIQINVTASIGITAIGNDPDMQKLFSYAEAALYTAKNEGKNRVVVLEDERDKHLVASKNKMITLMKDALIRDKFQIYLQPIYRAGDGLLHYEVLIRMLGENNNILLPHLFIPLAERYGLMPSIDRWVIANIIELLTQNRDLNVFINLSGSSLGDESLLKWIEFTLKQSNLNMDRIGFEITETAAIKDLQKAEKWIHKLKALGCRFALDDFGVGFSSFSYLDILPVDYLKIDGTFVHNLDSDPRKIALVKAMNMVAHTLGKKTIAEFVENESVWNILQGLGVDYGQGYYLGKPVPFENIHKDISK